MNSDPRLYNGCISGMLDTAEYFKEKSNRLALIFDGSLLLHDYCRQLFACGSYLSFARDAGGGVKLTKANFCRLRWCPMCQWRRSRRLACKLSDLWDSLRSSGFEFLHMVVTVRNCSGDDLPGTLDRMQIAYRHMMKDSALRGWSGAMRFTEVTYSKSTNTFHPHFHSLVVVRSSYFHSRSYVSTDRLRACWQAHMELDYLPQVYITKADAQAINEVAKYCVKPFEFEHSDPDAERKIYEELYTALSQRRLYQSFGVVREAAQSLGTLDDSEDSGEASGLSDYSFVYNYLERSYALQVLEDPA